MSHIFHPAGTLRGVSLDRSRPDLRLVVNLGSVGKELRLSYLLRGNDFYAQYDKVCRQLQTWYGVDEATRAAMAATADLFLAQFKLTTVPTTHREASFA